MKKKILFSASLIFLSVQGFTQQWIPANTTGPVKLMDIIQQHNASPIITTDKDEDLPKGIVKEGKDYQFDRWVWYWAQHTDENGFIVPPVKTFNEWQTFTASQQRINKMAKTTATSANWTFQGPDTSTGGYSGIGRINVITFHPTDSNTYWIGSPGGGAWKTTNNGASWTCMTDQLPVLGVSDIDFNPLNPKTVYLCTGDRDAGDCNGIGVLKSYDGGATWNTTGLKWTTSQYKVANTLVLNRLDTNCLILASSDSIRKSTDGGATWKAVQEGGFKQVIYNPADTNVLYAARDKIYYPSAVAAQIYRSTDGGNTWTQITSFSSAQRITLAVTAANPKIVKAVVSQDTGSNGSGLEGIYTSSDTGHTFRKIYTGSCTSNILGYDATGNSCGGQGWYDLAFTISPVDSNKVYVGGVNCWYSTDGGKNWTVMTQWWGTVPGLEIAHADKHYLAINPLVPRRVFMCCDGGVYRTDDPTSPLGWTNNLSNGLGITEFYRISVADAADYVLGGAQDNGTKKITPPGNFKDAGGGDGMQCQIDFDDPTTYYYSYQYGNFSRHTSTGDKNITDTLHDAGGWISPLHLMPTCSSCIVLGYKNVYYSSDQGDTWNAISSILPMSGYNIQRIGVTAADGNTIYVTTDYDDTVFSTYNLGASWSKIPLPNYVSRYDYMSDLYVDNKDKNHFWVTFSGYDASMKVMEYKSGVWSKNSVGLPNIPVACITQDSSNGTLYIGTDMGVFYKMDTMTSWQLYNTGMPAVHVTDLGINYTTGDIWAGTYGRGIWKSPKQEKPKLGVSIIPFAADGMVVSPNPNRGSFTISVKDNTATGPVSIRMVDVTGKTVWAETGSLSNGKISVTTQGLSHSNYILEVSKDNVVVGRTKVVVY